jgi:hypothetical protein
MFPLSLSFWLPSGYINAKIKQNAIRKRERENPLFPTLSFLARLNNRRGRRRRIKGNDIDARNYLDVLGLETGYHPNIKVL